MILHDPQSFGVLRLWIKVMAGVVVNGLPHRLRKYRVPTWTIYRPVGEMTMFDG